MPLWGNQNFQNNAPKYTTLTVDRATAQMATGTGNVVTATSPAVPNHATTFGNNTVGAFETLVGVGTFGVNTALIITREGANTTGNKGLSPGWVNAKIGTGPVTGITITAGGTSTGYVNGQLLNYTGGTANATAVITTNNTGGVASALIASGGAGFANVSVVAYGAVTNSTGGTTGVVGTNASSVTFTATTGGRSGRIQYETLVFIKNSGAGIAGGGGNTIS